MSKPSKKQTPPDSATVSAPLEANSNAVSTPIPTVGPSHATETQESSASERIWTAADVLALPDLTPAERAYASLTAAAEAIGAAMQHTGAAFAACQDINFSALNTRTQRLYRDINEAKANRPEFRGILGLKSIGEKEVARQGGAAREGGH